jgi:hypothetical protein
MGTKTIYLENPALKQDEVFKKYGNALEVLACRVLAEPWNFRAIDGVLHPAMLLTNDYFSKMIQEAQRQFRADGRYTFHTVATVLGVSAEDAGAWALKNSEMELSHAWDAFMHFYGQWVELQIGCAKPSWISQGMGWQEIVIADEKMRREKGLTAAVELNDGKDEFQQELFNAIECKAIEYPVRPPINSLRHSIPYFEPGEYVVVAGRTGMGKSFFGLNAVYQCALDGVPSCYVNLENTPKNVQRRLWQMRGGIKWQREYPGISDAQIMKMGDAWDFVKYKSKINAYAPARTLHAVLNTIRTDYYEHGCQLAVVDYLQKISESSFRGTRVDQLAEISAELRQLATDLKIPIIALAQINREGERNASKRPSIADIRGSGDIEQDASTILLLYRPAHYEITTDEDGNEYPDGYADIFIGKGRDTEQAKIKCRFNEVLGFHDAPSPFEPLHQNAASAQFPVHAPAIPYNPIPLNPHRQEPPEDKDTPF